MASVLSVLITGSSAGLNTALSAAAARIAAFQRQVGGGSAALGGLALAGVAAGVAVGAAFVAGASKSAEFEQAMSRAEAATMETGASLNALREAALDAGASTAFSAVEAADAITELGKAGISSADILGGALDGALALAAAGELDVATAAELAATAMTQFGLAGSDVPHIADLLAAGAGKAQGSVEDLGAALNQSALVANNAGLSIEDTTGALAQFAAAGLTGSDAGTAFKSMLQRLTPVSAESAALMDELGLSAYDAQGNFVGLDVYAQDLQDTLGGMTQEQRNATLATLFGSDAVRAATVLYQGGSAGVQQWAAAVDDAGFAAEQAAIKQDNLKGDLEKLGGAFDTLLIKIGTGAQEPLRALTQGLTGVVDGLSQLGEQDQLGPFFADISAIVENLWTIVGHLWDAVDGAVAGFARLAGGAVAVGLMGIASALEAITGFLADNADLVAALAIVVGVKLVVGFAVAAAGAVKLGLIVAALNGSALAGLLTGTLSLGAAFGAATAAAGRLVATVAPLAALTIGVLAVKGFIDTARAADELRESVADMWKAFDAAETTADKIAVLDTELALLKEETEGLQEQAEDGAEWWSWLGGSTVALARQGELTEAAAESQRIYNEAAAEAERIQDNVARAAASIADQFGITESAALELADTYGIDLTDGLSEFESAQLRFLSTTPDTTAAQEDAAAAAAALAAGYLDAAEAADALAISLDELSGDYLNEQEAIAAYEEALAAATATVKEYGRAQLDAAGNIDQGTEAGRAAFAALNELNVAGDEWIDAMIRQGDGAELLIAKDAALRADFLATAATFGITGAEAEALADKILGIPEDRATKFRLLDEASPQIEAIRAQLDGVTTEERVAQIRADADLTAAVQAIAAVTGIPYETLVTMIAETTSAETALNQTARPRTQSTTTVPFVTTAENEFHVTARPREQPTTTTPNTSGAESAFNSAARYRTQSTTASASTSSAEYALNYTARDRTSTITTYSRTVPVAAAEGAIMERFAAGGTRPNGQLPSQAMIAPATTNLVQWAEPSTGGEAFIPKFGDPARSLAILAHAASWYGHGLTQTYADGGMRGETFGRSLVAGNVSAIDYDRLAKAIANQPAPHLQVVGTFEGGPLYKLVDQRIKRSEGRKAVDARSGRR